MDLGSSNDDVLAHLETYLTHVTSNCDKWKKGKVTSSELRVPSLSEANSVASVGILQFASEQERLKEMKLAEERKKHQGYPPLQNGKLSKTMCLYCGKNF